MKIKLLIPVLFLFILTGCWNYRELNDLAIATGIAIDKSEDGFEVSVLIANARKAQVSTKEGESQTSVYSENGKTITEALRNINLKFPKEIYIGHLSVIVINEEIAKEGLYPILDYFLREPESSKRFYSIIARDCKAKEVISILSPLESFPSQNLYFNIKNSPNSQGVSPSVTFSKFIENILKPGTEPFLPTVIIEGDSEKATDSDDLQKSVPSANLKLDTMAIFKDDKLIGYADEDESRGIDLINEKVENTTSSFKYNNHYISISLSEIKVKKSIDIIDDEIIAYITLESIASIKEIDGDENLNDKEVINDIEKKSEEAIKNIIERGLDCALKKYKSDIFGFGNLIYKKDPKYFEKIKYDWDDKLNDLKTVVNVNLKLQTKGSLEQTIGGLLNDIKN